jgi:hypothetical protein
MRPELRKVKTMNEKLALIKRQWNDHKVYILTVALVVMTAGVAMQKSELKEMYKFLDEKGLSDEYFESQGGLV